MAFSRLPLVMVLEWLESVLRGLISVVRMLWRLWSILRELRRAPDTATSAYRRLHSGRGGGEGVREDAVGGPDQYIGHSQASRAIGTAGSGISERYLPYQRLLRTAATETEGSDRSKKKERPKKGKRKKA